MFQECDDGMEFKKEKDENCVVINIFCDKECKDKHDDKCKKNGDFKDECVRINIFCDKDKKEHDKY